MIADWDPLSMKTVLEQSPPAEPDDWLWNGYLRPGDITLLTSLWKTGKTTLLAGLLRCLETGEPFLGRPTRPARAWVVSEESRSHWRERLALMPIGAHVQLIARPFRGRPTIDDWNELIDRAIAAKPDLFVVDPLASFLPGRCESDAASLLEALQPLLRLTAVGIAVLLLHHPRKQRAEVGSSARGSGAMLGFVDTNVELNRAGSADTDANCRVLRAQSRRSGVPARLCYEWDPATGAFAAVPNLKSRQFEAHGKTILGILRDRTESSEALTLKEVAEYWPDDAIRPSPSTLYTWLNTAVEIKMIRREGRGARGDAFRYRLENQRDLHYDRLDAEAAARMADAGGAG